MSDPRKNVMSELAQQKSKLMQGQSNPRSQQFSGRDPRGIRPEAAYMMKTDSKWGNTYLPVIPRMDKDGRLIGQRGTDFI